jgi:hypothetical protein
MKSKFSNPLAEFPREVGVLVFASFFVAVGFGIISPTLPLFARSFGVSHARENSSITSVNVSFIHSVLVLFHSHLLLQG